MECYYDGFYLDTKDYNYKLSENEINNDFMRGIFDRYGSLNKKNIFDLNISCSIEFRIKISKYNFYMISSFRNIKNTLYNDNLISYKDNNAFDFLSIIYDNSDSRYRDNDKYNYYFSWIENRIFNIPIFICEKLDNEAIIPSKNRPSDILYNLNIVKKIKNITDKISLYDTGIIIKPSFGFYVKLFSKNLLLESGYILSNSENIIKNYDETIKVYLIKIDESLPELKLPINCLEFIFEKNNYCKSIF